MGGFKKNYKLFVLRTMVNQDDGFVSEDEKLDDVDLEDDDDDEIESMDDKDDL